MSEFLKSRLISLGGLGKTKQIKIGGGSEVLIQTMWKEPLLKKNFDSIVRELCELEVIGCSLVRFAVPDENTADLLVKLSSLTSMPLVADIHFDYKLALKCMEGNIAKVRINPGNIGNKERVREVLTKAKDNNTAIRIGINAGSLPQDLRALIKESISSGVNPIEARANAMLSAALREIDFFDKNNFNNFLVSMKSSSVEETVVANKMFAQKINCPLHLGVTEAGPLISGIVKSSLAFYQLLKNGIGDTVRVSLSDDIENEVIAAREILYECGLRKSGVKIVSCPRCGRDGFDVHGFVKRWQKELLAMKKNITVAVMGCVVNGPEEAKNADIGITGAGNSVLIFRKGEIVKKLKIKNDFSEADDDFRKELKKL